MRLAETRSVQYFGAAKIAETGMVAGFDPGTKIGVNGGKPAGIAGADGNEATPMLVMQTWGRERPQKDLSDRNHVPE